MQKLCSLRATLDFKKAFKTGKKLLSPRFALYIAPNSLKITRLGVSISKSHFKLATRRNALRRTAKEVLRHSMNPYLLGRDCVIASRIATSKDEFKNAEEELKELVMRASRIKIP